MTDELDPIRNVLVPTTNNSLTRSSSLVKRGLEALGSQQPVISLSDRSAEALTFPDSGTYIAEVKDGQIDGQGIEYSADGSVLKSGTWENEVFIGGKPQVSPREVAVALDELIVQSEGLLLERSMGRVAVDIGEDRVLFNALCLAVFAVDVAIWTALAEHKARNAVRDSYFACIEERMRNLEPPSMEPLNQRLEVYTDAFKDQSDVGGYNGIGKTFAELCRLPDDRKLRIDAIILFKTFNQSAFEFLTKTCLEKYVIVK